jgi:predicted helicase
LVASTTGALSPALDTLARRQTCSPTPAGKQKIVVELYDKAFRNAFPRMTERLGIVYTPVEVVDFIIHWSFDCASA